MAKGCVYIPKTGKDAGKVFGSKESLAAHMNYTPALTDLMAKFEQSGGKADIDSVTKWLGDNGYLKGAEAPKGKASRRERLAKLFEEPKVEAAPTEEAGVEATPEMTPEEVRINMKPITDEMAGIEMEFANNGYSIDWDYDDEIIITDKDGEIVDAEELPEKLLPLAAQYEKATAGLAGYDFESYRKALEQSRKDVGGIETEFEEVKPAALPEKTEEKPKSKLDEKKALDQSVNELITKKNRYNKIPKTRKPLAGKLLDEIKAEAEQLGFTVVNVKRGGISIVNKKDGKIVARREVDRKFNKERNDKLKEAKSMAQDSLLGLRASILLYFLRGGKVKTSQSELAGDTEIKAAKKAGFISDNGRSVDMIALEDLPELGGIVSDEQDAINEVLDVLASFENKAQMEDELVEMRDKLTNDMDEAAKYEYEAQMNRALDNGELNEDELVEYYESLSEDDKIKSIEDYEKFYREIEREQLDQEGEGTRGAYPSEGTTQEERGAEKSKSKRLQRAEELRAKAQDLRDASGGTLMAGPKLLAAAYEAYATILETTENIIEAIKKFKGTKEYKDLDVNGKKELDVVLATDAVEEEISSGRDPQEAVDDLIGSQDWYQSLSANQKEQLDEILKDDFGVTPVTKTGIKATIANIIDNYYKGDRQSKLDNKRILESDPKLKYIYDNISKINKQLQDAGVITDKTDGCP
jgi:hypothetical protein